MKISIATLFIALITHLTIFANKDTIELPPNRIEVYYLHGTFRCEACLTVENLTKAAIFSGKGKNLYSNTEIEVKPQYEKLIRKNIITFKSINTDEEKNAHFLKDFNTESQIPVIVLIKNNKIIKIKILEDVWKMLDYNDKIINFIQANINDFLKILNSK